MRKKITYIILSAWVIVIATMVAMNEYTLRTGEIVLLKTVPIDPRDLIKGDYVILDYEISKLYPYEFEEGTTVYTILDVDKGSGEAYRDRVTTKKPYSYILYMKGIVEDGRIKYGIEQYYVKEGTGKEIETKLRDKTLVEVAIDKHGSVKIVKLLFEK